MAKLNWKCPRGTFAGTRRPRSRLPTNWGQLYDSADYREDAASKRKTGRRARRPGGRYTWKESIFGRGRPDLCAIEGEPYRHPDQQKRSKRNQGTSAKLSRQKRP